MADRQFGAFASEDAIRAGYTPEEVQSEVSRGRWVRLRRGVYAERAVWRRWRRTRWAGTGWSARRCWSGSAGDPWSAMPRPHG
ncbi:type IV toxin-antitoxin system AbiEi family antitoxin domain-containing protein [Geodermatophilus obscurus]|uniref:type IV toxin-antitoxin system AbiEi family antitoxin domain-containing protein n=1 Tax=Geodermatophilus obscurus TaxID=1861 RepID=UPI0032AF4CA6